MAEFVFTDASLVINSVDLSDHVESVALNYSAEPLDDTVMRDTTRSKIGGLLDWSMAVTFKQDYAASKVDATLFSIVGTVVTVTLKPTSAAVSATNPSYSGSVLVAEYNPLGGSVGDMAVAPVALPSAGTLTRATS